MNTSKKLVISSIFTTIISVVLYGAIAIPEMDMIEFVFLPTFLYLAHGFLIVSIFFAVIAILISKGVLDFKRIRKVAITVTCVVLVACISLVGYNWFAFYNICAPDTLLENDEFIQQFSPYCDVNASDSEAYAFVSHITGADYITIYARGVYENDIYLTYEAEYFESYSLFLNSKFYLEKGVLSIADRLDVDSFTESETREINGMKVTLFTKEYGNDWGVFVSKGNKAMYAQLRNYYDSSVDQESFAEVVTEQFELIEKTVNKGAFIENA